MSTDRVREDLVCLIDSPYRGPILLELRDSPARREELREAVDASRSTISRALATFEERDWVTRSGQEYRLTHLGRLIADGFDALVGTIETAHDLEGIVEHVPIDDLPFGIGHLRDATIVQPSRSDPLAPIRHSDRFVEDVDSAVMLSHAFSPSAIAVIAERAKRGDDTHLVVTSSVVESLVADDELRDQCRECVAGDTVEIWEYDGAGGIPHVLAVGDRTVSLGVYDEAGHVRGVVETDDETVLAWAEETVEAYRDRATRLDVDRFTR